MSSFHPPEASHPPKMQGKGSGHRYPPGWDDSAEQVSHGNEWRQPMRHQPHDKSVSLPTSHTMNLKQLHYYQSAINPSVLCSGLPSIRWLHPMDLPLLYSCASSPLSGLYTMYFASLTFSFIRLWPSLLVACVLLWCSLAFCTFSLSLFSFAPLQPCRDCEGSPNAS